MVKYNAAKVDKAACARYNDREEKAGKGTR